MCPVLGTLLRPSKLSESTRDPQIQAVVLGLSQVDFTQVCFDVLLLAGPRGRRKRSMCLLADIPGNSFLKAENLPQAFEPGTFA